jgi:peroxiredoxin family protein
MWACRALLKPTADGAPGWAAMSVGEPGLSPARLDARFAAGGSGTFEELLAACAELGVRFIVCEAGMVGADCSRADLRTDLPLEVAGAVTFLRDASPTGAMLFV